MVLIFCLAGCAITPKSDNVHDNASQNTYIKSVFIAYYELEGFTKNNDEKTFKKEISKAFKELANKGFNRVTVQVRPCADAFYKSNYFPTSEYMFGYQGAKLIYDPLEIMIDTAHKYDLSIEAWINPYRVSQRNDFSLLAKNNIALKWQNTSKLIVLDNGIYFNPCYNEVTDLIVKGVKEILLNYNVDSLCFDDYFYPAKGKGAQFNRVSIAKRKQVINKMVRTVYQTVKAQDSNMLFGISPAGNIEYAGSLGCDLSTWLSNDGYIDYIVPQIYWSDQYRLGGKVTSLYTKRLNKWIKLNKNNTPMYIGLATYRAGTYSSSDLGWKRKNNNLVTQIKKEKAAGCDGFVLFSSSYMYRSRAAKEMNNYRNYIR